MPQGNEIDFVTAEAYLSAFPGGGRVLRSEKYAQTCYVLRDCLCAGPNGQVVMPLNAAGPSPVLEESFDYEFEREMKIAAFGLAMSRGLREERLEEAAPLFPAWGINNFWHWLLNCLPKAVLLESLGFRGQYIVNLACPFVPESLALMGIGQNRLKHCDRRFHVKNLFLAARIDGTEKTLGPALLSAVRESLMSNVAVLDGSKRCYVRRIGKRKINRENEAELLELLAKYDFETLVPEEHSLAGQIAFMSNAACTLAPHGANAALALFQKRKGILMELFGRKYINFCNLPIVNLLKLLYIPVCPDVNSAGHYYRVTEENKDEDYSVDLKLAGSILASLKSGRYGL